MGYLGRCVLVDVITYMIDRCLGPIDTHVGSRVSKERASRVSYAERFGVLLSMTWFTYGLKETQEFMERSKQRKSKWRDEKGCQVLDDVQRKLLQLYPNLYRVICSNWSVPHYIIHDFKSLLVAGVCGWFVFKTRCCVRLAPIWCCSLVRRLISLFRIGLGWCNTVFKWR